MTSDWSRQNRAIAGRALARFGLERALLLGRGQAGDPAALVELWQVYRLHLPLAERLARVPCVSGSCPAATGD